MKAIRIIAGVCIDLILFGCLIPLGSIRAGRMLDAVLFPSLYVDSLLLDLLGLLFIIAGGGWLLWALYLLISVGGGYITEIFCIRISPVTVRLVDRGPYALHRHPLGAGYLLILCGAGVLIGSAGTLLVAGGALAMLFYFYVRLVEEPCLKRRLGVDYLRYLETVPALLPIGRHRIPVAYRNLCADKVRFFISIAGVAFAVLLICFQLSILKGTSAQITTYIDHVGADIWVMQKGVDDFIATSAVPRESVHRVESLEGVRKAAGIFAVYTLLDSNRVKSRVYVIGYDTGTGSGGPWKLGKTLPYVGSIYDLRQNEVLLDQSLAKRHRLEPGDTVFLFGHSFTVAGVTLETTSIGSHYVFLPRKTVRDILPAGNFAFTHILVWAQPGAPAADLVRQIAAATSLGALTNAQLGENMRGFLGMFMLPLLTAGVVMGFLVGSVTIAITLYTSVLERFKEYGTLKALGATGIHLYDLLLRQSFVSLFIGSVIGFLLATAANYFINQWVPGMTAKLDAVIVVETLLAGVVMVLLSTGLPMWRLFKIDPLEAFRE